MSRIILMAIMLAVTVAGCNRFPDLTIQVTANLAPDDTDCTIQAEQETVLLRGLYDLAGPVSPYILTPRIESYIFDHSLEGQAPQGNFQVNGFDVTIKLPDGSVPELAGELPNPYFVTSSAVIPPNTELGDVSRGAAAAPVIPASYWSAIVGAANEAGFDSIVLDARATGTTAGGFTQTSPPFSWPIEFCTGCLRIDVCEKASDAGCFPGQDLWGYCASIAPPAP